MTFQDRLKKSPYIAAIMSTGMTRQRPPEYHLADISPSHGDPFEPRGDRCQDTLMQCADGLGRGKGHVADADSDLVLRCYYQLPTE